MQWPFKTTVKFGAASGGVLRYQYAVRAITPSDAKMELERRFLEEEIPGFEIEDVVPASKQEEAQLQLPDNCVQLLG